MIRPKNTLFSDLAQMANGAASAFGSLREDISVMRSGMKERQQAEAGMVTQEDFEAVLTRLDALAARIAALEAAQNKPRRTKSTKK